MLTLLNKKWIQAGLLSHAARFFASVLTGLLILCLSGCAMYEKTTQENADLFVVINGGSAELTTGFVPVFVLQGGQESYNRIGRVVAEKTGEYEKITIDPDQPVIYADTFSFSTQRGSYMNLVYRVHFQKTPFSLIPFHLAAGNNVGLLVIVTLSKDHVPLLVTTANTCGCYAVVIPTDALSRDKYPVNWPGGPQNVYGELLPAAVPEYDPEDALLITVRSMVHRVMDVSIARQKKLAGKDTVQAKIMTLQSLEKLPLENGEFTSLYYDRWPLQGHVKGAIKPWESLLLGLVSLDFYVGMDKAYGDTALSGNPFYTSLLPWNRQVSDMNNFAQFLSFRGWKL